MQDLNHQREYWDRVAGRKRFTIQPDLEGLARLVPPPARVLDYGCGYGRVTARLAEAGYHQAAGLDISPRMIERGRRQHPGLDLRVIEALPTPFEEQSFDAVVLLAVLTCLPGDQGQEEVAAEAARLLGPGGVLYVADFLLNQDQRNLERYRKYAGRYGAYGVFELADGAVLRHHHPAWIEQLLAGFERLSMREAVSPTMNGHQGRVFHYFGRKPGRLKDGGPSKWDAGYFCLEG